MRAAVHLPVVERLRVVNYPLYPGSSKHGLDLPFDKGVTVIAGINGIGKTTLLNLLLRMLLGPTSPSKAATRDMGLVSKRSLVTAKKFSFFQDRVAVPLPANATATLDFRINGTPVTITRRLSNLEITKVSVGGKAANLSTNSAFMEELAQLSGLASAYDFHVVVRYVQFFTEERLPLLWSPTAQLELFKMLFVDPQVSRELNELYSAIQPVDTNYRNRIYQHNLRRAKYEQERAKHQVTDANLAALTEQLQAAKAQLAVAHQEYRASNDAVTAIASARDAHERQIDELQATLDAEVHAFHKHDAAFIAQALPSLEDKFALLMQGLGSNLGCFVCGKRGKKEAAAIGKRLRTHHCFVCDATLPSPESSTVTPISSAGLRKIERRIEQLQQQIEALGLAREQAQSQLDQALEQVKPAATQRHELAMRVELLTAQMPDMSGQPAGIEAELDAEKAEIDALAEKRAELGSAYRHQLDLLHEQMKAIENTLGGRLQAYAEAFLHEKVAVNFLRNHRFKLATGAAQVNLPVFRISMTSSTHLAAQERSSPSTVSESQKEFLDLAFRMTLLDMLAQDGATMLVMETPEASLDSWFMARAATMIRRFAPEGGQRALIATSNINGTTMIPGLLGLDRENGPRTLPASQRQRLVNLMALAEEPGVLRHDPARQKLSDELGGYLGS